MKKILIVDDEFLVRIGLKSAIDWEANGFVIAGEASNGEEAYDFIQRNSPDIVLLDIKMPVMDGIQLLKKLKEEKLKTCVIILSCYNEFEYVKEAMKLGASDYVRKLSSSSEHLLKTIKLAGTDSPDDYPGIETAAKKMLKPKKSLWNLIFKYDREIWDELFSEGLQLHPGSYFVAAIKIDDYNVKLAGNEIKDPQMHCTSVLNIIHEILSGYYDGAAFDCGPGRYIIIANQQNDTAEILNGISDSIRRYLSLTLSIGYCNHDGDLQAIPQVYRLAKQALDRRYVDGPGKIIEADGLARMQENPLSFSAEAEVRFKQSILDCDVESAIAVLDRIISNIRMETSKNDIIEVVRKMLLTMDDVLKTRGYGFETLGVEENVEKALAGIRKFEFCSDMSAYLHGLLETFFEKLNDISQYDSEIDRAIAYINGNYSKKMDLETLSRQVNLNPSYLSHMFKQYSGKGFVEYLTSVRMEAAKNYLKHSHLSVSQIAERVGYENIYYFSKVFKREIGTSPNQFRRQV